MKKVKTNAVEGFKAIFAQMDIEEAQAEVDYKKLLIEDECKTFMDILPKEFSSFKRGIIKREILENIDDAEKILNASGLFDRVITKKDIVRYMMRGTKYCNFYLANKFIPRTDQMDVWAKFWKTEDSKSSKAKKEKAMAAFRKANEAAFDKHHKVTHCLSLLTQAWESYENRQKIKAGGLVHEYDMEDNGFPSTSRGCMCYLFIPVKGNFPVNAKGFLRLHNPRSRKTEKFKILKYNKEDNIYACNNPQGKKVFLAPFEDVADSYDALFDINKEIYSGWWNKTMTLK